MALEPAFAPPAMLTPLALLSVGHGPARTKSPPVRALRLSSPHPHEASAFRRAARPSRNRSSARPCLVFLFSVIPRAIPHPAMSVPSARPTRQQDAVPNRHRQAAALSELAPPPQ